jgi:hypothetical protein
VNKERKGGTPKRVRQNKGLADQKRKKEKRKRGWVK